MELELLTLLRRGQTDWTTFNRDRIITALTVAPVGPVIALPPAQHDPIEEVPQIQPNSVADPSIGTIFFFIYMYAIVLNTQSSC